MRIIISFLAILASSLAVAVPTKSIVAGRHQTGVESSPMLFRWVRMHISAVRWGPTATQSQLSEIELCDSSGIVFPWPIETTCHDTAKHTDEGIYGNRQKPDKLIDGNTSTKMCRINMPSIDHDIYIDLGEAVLNAQQWNTWRWFTGDDNPARDPTSFSLSLSVDGENWIIVDSVVDAIIPEARKAVGYTGRIAIGSDK